MKKIFTILAAVLITATTWAQSPEKMSYQAVIRNASGELVTTQVSMKLSVLKGADATSATEEYSETLTPTPNANGLVSIEFGGQAGWDAIDWSSGRFFIKTETDIDNDASYDVEGVSQLLSVPYALHAKTAEAVTGGITETDPVYTSSEAASISASDITNLGNLSGTNTGDQDITGIATNEQAIQDTASQIRTALADTATALRAYVDANAGGASHYVGELYGGGIVFWVDHTGEHGLIASLDDLDGGSGVAWSNVTSTEIGATAKSMTDGASNTAVIIAQSGHASSAAKLCNDYTGGGFTDWYLPANRELYLLASQDILIDNILDNDGDATTNGFSQENTVPTYGRYWSSTEDNNSTAWLYLFGLGYSYANGKHNAYRVRAVRAF